MSNYDYSGLSLGPDSIRLLRLMPYENESIAGTEIECELFIYPLQDQGKRSHLYEALSYVWGDSKKLCSISVNKQNLAVTENLHAALFRLRDRFLPRILWIDAICINQEDCKEQSQQVQLMAKIYSKAYRVLVWLGEESKDIEGALDDIYHVANEESTEYLRGEINQQAILNLLQRPWFQRIWVLQEVAAARNVVMTCGPIEIDGYAFCIGLKSLKIPYSTFPDLQSVPSLTYLIERAGLRSKYTKDSLKRSLEIYHLAELIDMFHARKATDVRDKVYALLGMSRDDPGKAGLLPNYKTSWKEVFQQLTKFILGKAVSVETSNYNQRAVINSKGCVLGQITSVSRDDRQRVTIISKNAAWYLGGKREWSLQASAKSIREGDIICLLQGALKPTIIRLYKDYSAVVLIAATPLNERRSLRWPELSNSNSITHFTRDLLLIWDWEMPLGESQDWKEYENLKNSRPCSKTEFGDHSDKATRIWNIALILGDLKEYKKAEERLQEAIEDYERVVGQGHRQKPKSQYGLTPLSWAAGNGDDEAVKLLVAKDSVDPNLRDSQYGRTPLSWAALGGHKAVVKLLIGTGQVEVDSKDNTGRTPLSWAAMGGYETVAKLLIGTGQLEVDSKDDNGRTPLLWAAEGGHDAVVKLLVGMGQVKVDSKDDNGRTPLSLAAEGGHDYVVKLLLEMSHVEVGLEDKYGWTPLSWAAVGGHQAVVKQLLETSQVEVNLMDNYGRTPLWWAAVRGHEAVVKLLLMTSQIKVGSNDKNNDQTSLSLAAIVGHEAVAKLLLETSQVEIDLKDKRGRTPLLRAAELGHNAVVKLLLESGRVEVDSKDERGQTLLSLAALGGHQAMVKQLLETSQVEINSKDNLGQTPLSLAVIIGHETIVKLFLETGQVEVDSKYYLGQTLLSLAVMGGHEAVVKLLLEISQVEIDSKDIWGQTPLFWAVEGGHDAVVKLLIGTGQVKVDSKDDNGRTPLSLAAEGGHDSMVKLLLETGQVEVDSKDKRGRTPLWWAADKGHKSVVKLLE